MANTYAKPSRGRTKQVKTQLKKLTKGSESVSEFMQNIKAPSDEVALLGAPLDAEDLIEKVDSLGDDYKELVRAVQASERCHLHIVETGLALLTHASLSLAYWSHAFANLVYLIIRMPTPPPQSLLSI